MLDGESHAQTNPTQGILRPLCTLHSWCSVLGRGYVHVHRLPYALPRTRRENMANGAGIHKRLPSINRQEILRLKSRLSAECTSLFPPLIRLLRCKPHRLSGLALPISMFQRSGLNFSIEQKHATKNQACGDIIHGGDRLTGKHGSNQQRHDGWQIGHG